MSLDVHLGGKRIGSLHPSGGESLPPDERGRCSFAYLPELVEEAGGAPLLSYALPVRAEPYGPSDTCPYLEGLLPTGSRRRMPTRSTSITTTPSRSTQDGCCSTARQA